MMNVLSVLKSRTSTAGFCGVIIVDSRSTGVEMSTNGNAGCMIDSTGCALDVGVAHQLVVEVRLVQRADQAVVARDRDLREVVLAHQPDARARPARSHSSEQSSPDSLIATRSRAVMPRLLEEALLAHPVVVEHLAEIARAVVVEDHDDHVVVA